jgi:alkylated DNA repair dioxygenase AlkB
VLAAALSERYGIPYDGLWMNVYRNERDRTGWHGDWHSCKRDDCIVPVLSLGATRRLLLKARSGGPSTVLAPAGGDLVLMGGRCQRDWRHAAPKQTKPAGMRMSLNFQSTLQMTPEPR